MEKRHNVHEAPTKAGDGRRIGGAIADLNLRFVGRFLGFLGKQQSIHRVLRILEGVHK